MPTKKVNQTIQKTNARSLQEGELLFSSFVQQNIDGIILIDSEGVVTEWNASMERLSGFNSMEMIGLNAWEMQFLINREERPSRVRRRQLEETYRTILQSGVVPEGLHFMETTLITREGKKIYAEQKIFVIRTSKGNWIGVIVRDMTERKQSDEKLRELEVQLQKLNNNISNGYTYQIDFGFQGELRKFLYISAGVEKLIDISVDQVLKSWKKFSEFFLPDDNHKVAELESNAFATMTPFRAEVRYKQRGGQIGWLLLHSTPRKLANGHIVWDGVALDITERKQAEEKIQKLAITDALTGLFNRHRFFEIARMEFVKSSRYQRPLSVMLLDIDQFKKINDTYGHIAGDQVLKQIGDILRKKGRGIDTVARYGGEEFIMLFPETNCSNAVIAAKRLRSLMENHSVQSGGDTIRFTASFGVSELDKPERLETLDQLISEADMALYEAKRAGGNRVVSHCQQ